MRFMEIKIVPGILEKSTEEAEKKIDKIKGLVDEVMIDIIDGKFADNMTIGIEDLVDIDGDIGLGAHLMVDEPIKMIDECVDIGVETVIGHIELMKNQENFVRVVLKKEMQVGLGLDLKTAVDFLEEEILEKVGHVLLMAVPAGFSGQKFDRKVLDKIKILRKDYKFKGSIWVDGGVNEETIEDCVKVGANRLSVTSALWQSKEIKEGLERLTKLALKASRS